jgi:hypothetical protein
MPNKLTELRIDEISSVDRGAGDGCKVILMKRDAPIGPLLFDDAMRNSILKHKETIMPQVDILKAATIMEEALMAGVTKRDDETYAKAFSRRYEHDIDFRRQWSTVTEAKQLMALKGLATLTPTSTGVGNTNVSDDSAEAVRLLGELAAKNGRSFEQVFADPANAKLAARTYAAHHRSSVNTDYLEQ